MKINKFIKSKVHYLQSRVNLFRGFLVETRVSDYETWKQSNKSLAEHFTDKSIDFLMVNLLAGLFINIVAKYIFNQPMTFMTVIAYSTIHWLLFKVLSKTHKE